MNPRDFLAESTDQPITADADPRDFLAEFKPPKESLGTSALLAAPRVAEDILRSGFNAFRSIPGYYRAAQTAIPMAAQTIRNNPMGALSQAAAGIPEMGHNLLNIPRGIVNYGENRLNLLPEGSAQYIPEQRDITGDINQLFGAPKNKGEELIRGTFRNLDTLIPAASLTKSAITTPINAMRSINPEKVAKSIQKSHDKLLGSAESGFEHVGNEVANRNISQVPIRKNLIADITDHSLMPGSEKVQDILTRASSGDYQGLRELQSELFHRSNRAKGSPYISEQNAGETLADLRNEVNKSIENHLLSTGHPDLAKRLNQSRKQYAILQDTYFGDNTPKAIKDLVDRETRKMPKNMMNVLDEQSIPMDKIKAQNPFAAKKSRILTKKENAIANLKRLGYLPVIGGTLAGVASLPALYNKFLGSEE